MMSVPKRLKFEFVMLAILAGVFVGANLPHVLGARSSAYDFFDPLVDLRYHLVTDYVEPVDEQAMLDGAINGILDTLDDPYTNYFPPKQFDNFEKQTAGTFSGIGAEIDVRNGQLILVAPLEDSPAYKAGVQPGDIVLEIDGEPVPTDITASAAIDRITGEEGTPVQLKVKHPNGNEASLTITRARIKLETIRGCYRDAAGHWQFMLDKAHQVGYVRMTQFAATTFDELNSALAELQAAGMKGLILDLRYNPGGLLKTAVKIADLFLDQGTIVSTRGRNVPEHKEVAHAEGTLPDFPLVVLVNQYSASASEILSGALKDHRRAIILGTRTLGKGSVQRLFPIEGGEKGGIKITTSYYYLPSGRNIHRHRNNDQWGVDPTDGYYVPMTLDEREAMANVRRGESPFITDAGENKSLDVTPAWIRTELKDKQLAAALKTMLGRLNRGGFVPVGHSNATVQAHLAERENMLRIKEIVQERLNKIDDRINELTDKIEKIQNGDDSTKPAEPTDDDKKSDESAPTDDNTKATDPASPQPQPAGRK